MVDVIFLGLNDIGEQIYEWLVDRDDATVRAILTEKDQLSLVEEVQPDLVISGGFRYIVPEQILEVPSLGAVNLHKSYLPYNRGTNPNVWCMIDDTPAGVTIHYMTASVDAGPIIDRREVQKRPGDTAKDLYERLERAQFDQFREVWPDIRDDDADTISQDTDAGSYYYRQDFVDLWELEMDAEKRVGDVITKLRALTFEPFKNAYYEVDGQRYYVEVDITPDEAVDQNATRKIPTQTEDEQP